jgi:hypothetical protein
LEGLLAYGFVLVPKRHYQGRERPVIAERRQRSDRFKSPLALCLPEYADNRSDLIGFGPLRDPSSARYEEFLLLQTPPGCLPNRDVRII